MRQTLLLVEDQPDVARTLTRALRAHGYEIRLANRCASALAFQGVVDCAVLDLELPDGNGMDLAVQLLGKQANAVVFYSGCADSKLCRAAARLGPFIPKPAGLQDLAHAIEYQIAKHTASSSGTVECFTTKDSKKRCS